MVGDGQISSPNGFQWVGLLIFAVLLFVHTSYVSHLLHRLSRLSPPEPMCSNDTTSVGRQQLPQRIPDVFIYRRTKKTGSTSLLEPLLRIMEKYNYTSLYSRAASTTILRNAQVHAKPKRFFVAIHNADSRRDTGDLHTVIADTFRDGYSQVTSYCRYSSPKSLDCGPELAECLRCADTLREQQYRFSGSETESKETYIDLPLSAEHPALSTAVFRTVFPGEVLFIQRRNSVGSTCPHVEELRNLYNELYNSLERQIDVMRERMLTLTGYPTVSPDKNVTLVMMLDEAERLEKKKLYEEEGLDFGTAVAETKAKSTYEVALWEGIETWTRDASGNLSIKRRAE